MKRALCPVPPEDEADFCRAVRVIVDGDWNRFFDDVEFNEWVRREARDALGLR